jgi:hypothetical protein
MVASALVSSLTAYLNQVYDGKSHEWEEDAGGREKSLNIGNQDYRAPNESNQRESRLAV